jgi:two-component system nitrate/nitrite response regulator NarL
MGESGATKAIAARHRPGIPREGDPAVTNFTALPAAPGKPRDTIFSPDDARQMLSPTPLKPEPGAPQGGFVLIVEDHPIVANGLKDLVSDLAPAVRVLSCGSLASALVSLAWSPSLVLLDLGLPDAEGLATLEHVRRAAPCALVVVFSGQELPAGTGGASALRGVPFLSKSMRPAELRQTLLRLIEQAGLGSPARPHRSTADDEADGDVQSLSPKQREILRLLATGRMNTEIAELLGVSAETIKTHLREIYVRLQVKNRTQAVAVYQKSLAPRTP